MTRIGSLCSGYGGLDLAVESVLGGDLAWVADNDPDVARILAHRFPAVKNLGDLTTVDWATVEPVEVLTVGTPCQDVSAAGQLAGLKHGNRSGVWHEAVRAIAVLRPDLVVIENVLGLLTSRGDEPTAEHLAAEAARDAAVRLRHWVENEQDLAVRRGDTRRVKECRARAARVMGAHKRAVARCRWHESRLVRAIGTVLGSLAALGFDAEWVVLSAADAGACHLRKRVFILAWPAADPEGTGYGDAGEASERGIPAATVGGAAADARGDEPGRHGSVTSISSGDEGNRPRAGDRGAPEDPDSPAGGEWREPASGQADSGRPRADAGGPGGAPAADTEGGGRHDGDDGDHAGADAGGGAASRHPGGGGGAAADADDHDGPELAASRHEPGRRPPGGNPVPADAERGGRDGGPPDSVGGPGGRVAAAWSGEGPGGRTAIADAGRDGRQGRQRADRPHEGRPPADAAGRGPAVSGGAPAADPCGAGREGQGHAGTPGRQVAAGHPAAHPGGARLGEHAGGTPAEEAGADAGDELAGDRRSRADTDWGPYEPAIRRWEHVTGRPAPRPTEPGRTGERLSPLFVEWMQGLAAGWVTDVPGLSRNAMLKALGNGVVPQQGALAVRLLLDRAGFRWLERAA